MKLKKNWIKMNNAKVENTDTDEVKTEEEEKEMNFFQKHKKGFLLGGLGALAAAGAGLLIAKKCSDDYEEDDFNDDYEDEAEETTEE